VIILLTGGTGSFGAAFVNRHSPNHTIRVFSRGELAQSRMQVEYPDVKFFIGDVRDRDRLARAAKGADLIVHAAALKQVPACEYNPSEAVATNVTGTQNVCDVANCRVILISTDKAVQPQTTYGYTKALAEKIASIQGSTICRYGNVVDSRGSVTEVFRTQANTGELRITHPDMTRFWLTQDQAQDLVSEAMDGRTGLMVPHVPSARVVDLAQAMYPDLPQRIVGIRAGEKIHETLLTQEEAEDGVEYRSDTNPLWYSTAQLRRLVGAPDAGDPPRHEHALQGEVA
jgi:UDP-N-acetylglucosamine 4,6-dehydratase